jgi:preprotein translocase subunit SecA
MTANLVQDVSGFVARCLQFLRPLVRSYGKRDGVILRKIRAASAELGAFSDAALSDRVRDLRCNIQTGPSLTDKRIVVPGFALVLEAMRRTLDVCLYDEQLLAGLVLMGRNVAEMQTGEGKTYVASFPAFLHALGGQGVHIVTANDYLAKRDYQLLAPVFERLGVTVSLLTADASVDEKRRVYAADITYGVDQEFGFDYLRDHLRAMQDVPPQSGSRYLAALRGQSLTQAPKVQRPLATAVIDEIDSILIDSSTAPLLLSRGAAHAPSETNVYAAAHKAAAELVLDEDFSIDRTALAVRFTQIGLKKVAHGNVPPPSEHLRRPWPIYIEQAILAQRLLRRDVDYVVRDGRAMLVDEYTGRILSQRQWREGLHQSVELKEGLQLHSESAEVARISKQRYFRLYPHLCGMTATARGGRREFRDVYRLQVVVIPPRKMSQRRVLPARLFANQQQKYEAVVNEIDAVHRRGQPILVGVRTIENSERLAGLLDSRGIPYRLLNGKQDLAEAIVISRAGEVGAITIATNMAGRGTDIRLGIGAAELGGLHVIGTEQHESARIDWQLIGRCARQGDPGSCRIFGSAEDPLIEKHVPRVARLMKTLANTSGEVVVDLAPLISWVQRHVEHQHYQVRRRLLRYDQWLENLLKPERARSR